MVLLHRSNHEENLIQQHGPNRDHAFSLSLIETIVMNNYTFYLPGIEHLTSLSNDDWEFLCERAKENNVLPATLASQLIANELAMWRDQIHYADEMEQRQANEQMVIENQLEHLHHEQTVI